MYDAGVSRSVTTTSCGHGEGPAETFEAPGNVLLRAPSLSDATTEVCPTVGAHEGQNLLLISLSGNPDRRLDAWQRQAGLPEKVAILSADETRGAVEAGDGSTSTVGPGGTEISRTTISEPSDLTGIGIKMSKCLSAWEDDDVPTSICFDSVTTLLQFAGTRRAFRFLHVMTKRITSSDNLAHYHIDPGAHDAQTLATIESIFPEAIEFDKGEDAWVAQ